jgi:hypothetical protein
MFLRRRAPSVREAYSHAAILDPIVYTASDPEHLTTLEAYTACYGDSFTFLYVDDVHASQETNLRVSTASYGIALPSYI